MVLARSACVPTTISTVPSVKPAFVSDVSFDETRRERCLTLSGQPANRSEKVRKCCLASNVVGAMTATCMPLIAAIKAARRATSVLPNPTSPQTSRSIGRPEVKSSRTSSIACSWSSVSSYGNLAANSSYMPCPVSTGRPFFTARAAAITSSSCAISRMRFFAFALRVCHPTPPSRSSALSASSAPYREIRSIFSTGRKIRSPPAYSSSRQS